MRAAFGDEPLVGVTDLGPDLPWWRLRRPEELRAFAMDLLPVSARPGAAAIRHLLGIAHPITRSWLGDVWVEGPEIPFEAVEEGVVVGGVHVRQSLVQDAALWGWAGTGRSGVESPALLRSVVIGGTAMTGGRGRVWGTMLGVLILIMISNMLTLADVEVYWQGFVKGVIIILAVLIQRGRAN